MSACLEVPRRADNVEDSRHRTETIGRPGPISVWLVDDSENFRTLMAELLESEEGFECPRHFPSAEAVLDALVREPAPAVILLDVRMPGLGGLDAIRPIKSIAGATHVIMLTTFYDSYARAQALRDGASDLLLKISPLEDISQRIRHTVESGASAGSVLASGHAEPQDSDSGGEPDRMPSRWPNRRAPEPGIGRFSNDDMTIPHPEPGRRSASWGCVSSRLARGVNYLRELLKPGAHRRHPAES